MSLQEYVFQDWQTNAGSRKARFIVVFFRIVQFLGKKSRVTQLLCTPIFALYELLVVWILKVEIRYPTRVGSGLCLARCGVAIVHQSSLVGRNCTIGNCVTIGTKKGIHDCPTIGDNVTIGPNAVIIGSINIGDGATIEAGSVVTHDVSAGQTVGGNPATVKSSP